jgi:hypothetical protein
MLDPSCCGILHGIEYDWKEWRVSTKHSLHDSELISDRWNSRINLKLVNQWR